MRKLRSERVNCAAPKKIADSPLILLHTKRFNARARSVAVVFYVMFAVALPPAGR
jgi:hypothetical protein